MTRLLRYFEPYVPQILLAIILLFAQAMCDLSLPDMMSDIVSDGIINGNTNYIFKVGFQMVGVALLSAACTVTVGFLAARLAAGVARAMRQDVFTRVESFSSAEMDRFSSSSLITRTTNDITQVQTLIVMLVRMVFYAPILGVGGIMHALSKDVSMSWIILVAVFMLITVVAVIFSLVMPKFQLVQSRIDRLNLIVRENLDGILVIRAFDTQKFEEQRFDKANRDLTKINLFVNRATSSMMPAMMLIMNLTTLLVVWIGAQQASSFNMDVGDMMAYMQYVMQIIQAFLMMAVMFVLIPRAFVSVQRILEVLATKSSIRDAKDAQAPAGPVRGVVEYRDVSFHYPGGDEDVISHISFTAEPGRVTAFIGATGSGKSTIVNLLPRLYDVTEGEILIDGIDIRKWPLKELRKNIGFVPQKGVLFSGTIETNLAYGDSSADEERIHEAADIAQATEFITAKPEGYEAPIAQGGDNVSGGQKQRLSIARALVKHAPIDVFDDSFSALDFKTDSKLRAALKEKAGQATQLLVAQRISSIMHADQIIVLEHGHMVGKGTHRELMKDCEVYRQIALSQLSEEELK